MAGGQPLLARLQELLSNNQIGDAVVLMDENQCEISQERHKYLNLVSTARSQDQNALYASLGLGYTDGTSGKLTPFNDFALLVNKTLPTIARGYRTVSFILFLIMSMPCSALSLPTEHILKGQNHRNVFLNELTDVNLELGAKLGWVVELQAFHEDNKECFLKENINLEVDTFESIKFLSLNFPNISFVLDTVHPQSFESFMKNGSCFFSYRHHLIPSLNAMKHLHRNAMSLYFNDPRCLHIGGQNNPNILSKKQIKLGNFFTCYLHCIENPECQSFSFIFSMAQCIIYGSKFGKIHQDSKILTADRGCSPLNLIIPEVKVQQIFEPVNKLCSWTEQPPKILKYKCADTFNILESKFQYLINMTERIVEHLSFSNRTKRNTPNQISSISFLQSLLPISMTDRPTSSTREVELIEQFLERAGIKIKNNIQKLINSLISSDYKNFKQWQRKSFSYQNNMSRAGSRPLDPCQKFNFSCVTDIQSKSFLPINASTFASDGSNKLFLHSTDDIIQYSCIAGITLVAIISWVVFICKNQRHQEHDIIQFEKPEPIYSEIKRDLPFVKTK